MSIVEHAPPQQQCQQRASFAIDAPYFDALDFSTTPPSRAPPVAVIVSSSPASGCSDATAAAIS
jgi:hypothetical protein